MWVALRKALVPALPPPPQPEQPLAARSCSTSCGQEQEQARAGPGIAPQGAPSDATLRGAQPGAEALPWPLRWLHPLLGVLVLGPWGTDSPCAAVPWDPVPGCAGGGGGFLCGSPGCWLGPYPRPPRGVMLRKGSGFWF